MIFRNDDVSPNTDRVLLDDQYKILNKTYPGCHIWSCVTLFGKYSNYQSVYPDVPFKDKDLKYFYDVDVFVRFLGGIPGKIVSHGILHFDHSAVSKEMQEMSILTSCNFLNSDTFIAPFNRWNQDTIDICRENKIILGNLLDWKSLEHNDYDKNHKFWYFHSWRFSESSLGRKLNGHSAYLG